MTGISIKKSGRLDLSTAFAVECTALCQSALGRARANAVTCRKGCDRVDRNELEVCHVHSISQWRWVNRAQWKATRTKLATEPKKASEMMK